MNFIKESLIESAELKRAVAEAMADRIEEAIVLISDAVKSGKKVLLMGNGGSAADAQHIAGELVGRFKKERKAIPTIALSTDTSILTAIGNDYGFERVFERQLEALGEKGDVVIGISTSGNSENVYRAMRLAKENGLKTIGLLGNDGGKIKELSDIPLIVPSKNTPRIQEVHITIGHIICEGVERKLGN
ncbi:MAG: D-sedoheptulose 7-phosphate isomerase [Nitrospinae bacterium]|nr:D-sedoheptulose 7-phosphate isomerase [Nitrospinota bacterium]